MAMNHNQKKLTVTKSNWLIEASYKLKLDEQRLVLSAIAKIDSRKGVPDEVTITAQEFAELYNIDMSNAYRQLKAATDNLYERDIKVNDTANNRRRRMRWVDAVDYYDQDGKVTISFARRVKKYLGELNSYFTSYRLEQVAGLRSTYSIRLYEMMQQFIKDGLGVRDIELVWLREYLDLGDKYPLFKDFNKWVLKPALKELNDSTNMKIWVETKKRGRTITGLRFMFMEDDQHKLPFD